MYFFVVVKYDTNNSVYMPFISSQNTVVVFRSFERITSSFQHKEKEQVITLLVIGFMWEV